MAILRPGGLELTDRGMELAEFSKGSRILDVGCGEGDSVAHLNEDLGMDAEGIDMNLVRISDAKEQHPGININFGDGEFLDAYMSFTFDGVLMEGSLSQINMPDEALHEAYCVMKKGGKLIISDLYEIDPDPQQMKAVRIEADRQARMPHKEGECEDRGLKFTDFRFEGAFYEEPLRRVIEEVGFRITGFEDHSEDAEKFFEYFPHLNTESGGRKRRIGYFLLTAEKPEK